MHYSSFHLDDAIIYGSMRKHGKMHRHLDDIFIYRVKKQYRHWNKVDNWVMDICIIGTILLD